MSNLVILGASHILVPLVPMRGAIVYPILPLSGECDDISDLTAVIEDEIELVVTLEDA